MGQPYKRFNILWPTTQGDPKVKTNEIGLFIAIEGHVSFNFHEMKKINYFPLLVHNTTKDS
jgi:hypothetical protein